MDVIIGDDVQNSTTSLVVNGGGMGGGVTSSGGKGFMLFGVRLMEEGSFRKSASMNNLGQFGQLQESNHDIIEAGYESDDIVHPSGKSRERKRGVPWTEEEHKLFLLGLQKVGKGDWRGISRNFVKTRTPTQVASHAQKYFLRRNNHNRRRRRSSLFDITTETVPNASIVDHQDKLHNKPPMQHQKLIVSQNMEAYSTGTTSQLRHQTPMVLLHSSSNENINAMEGLTLGGAISQIGSPSKRIPPLPNIPTPPSAKLEKLNLNNTINDNLSLKLSNSTSTSSSSSSSSSGQQSPPTRHVSAFQALPSGFSGGSSGDSIISVA